jgi:ABC-2 type transport system ATP-binding protein
MNPIIEAEKLERSFGEQKAVDGMTFHVKPGEVFGLLGPNGAGNGILPLSAGTARVFGFNPTTQGELIRHKTGVLTETPALYERLTARENLEFFGTLQDIPETDLKHCVDDMLNFFELSARGNDKVETYSKGMKQRLALARALIHKPPLLFLDEPTSEAAQQANDLIASLRQTDGQTVVLATHNLLEAQRLCDRVAIINNGHILAMGSLDELSRKLWPVKWVDIKFYSPPTKNIVESLKTNRGVMQATAGRDALSVQVESDEVIPAVIRYLVEQGTSILKVNPRDYTLEDIYFALQAGEA